MNTLEVAFKKLDTKKEDFRMKIYCLDDNMHREKKMREMEYN